MQSVNPTKRFLILAVLGIVAGAILAFSLQHMPVVHGIRNVPERAKDLTVAETPVQCGYNSAWQVLRKKSEVQIRANDKRIKAFKVQRAKTSKTFRATFDKRVAELERRNIALKGKLNDYQGDRGEVWAEIK
jgi:hypothetical protein